MVDFFELTDSIIAEEVNIIVDSYYRHTLENPSHQSNNFKNDFAEHFGSFTDSNLKPYITKNTAALHYLDHQECVQNLIQGL